MSTQVAAAGGLVTAMLLAPAAVSLLLRAGHFYRAGNPPLALAAIAALGLPAVRRPWSRRALQAVLALGAVEWLRTLAALAATRLSMGLPTLRLTLILAAVAALAAAAALLLETARARRAWDGGATGGSGGGGG